MKLAKKISKGIALCAALTIMGTMGGVLTSCSNGSEETEPEGIEKTISEVDDVTFNVKTASVGEEKTNVVFTYTRSANGAKERIIIKNCDIEILCNGEKQKTINRLEFALNEYGDFMGDNATQYQCKISIGKKLAPGDIVKVVFNKKTGNVIGEGTDSAKIDTLTVSLIDNDEHAGEDGWYNELVENEKEYQPLFPKVEGEDEPAADDDKDKEKDPPAEPKPAEPTVIYKLDFSGEKLPENYYADTAKFEANVGAKIEGAWTSFSIVPSKDASALKDATHVRVTFKCSSDAAFADGDSDNNKFMVGLYKDGGEDNDYAETNVRWTCFFDGGEDTFPKDFTTVEKQINWEQKCESDGKTLIPYADFASTSNFRIWDRNFETGTLTVQSIEFIKK